MANDSKDSEEKSPSNRTITSVSESNVRPLADSEIESLQQALGQPIDRDYLIHWMSESIGDVVRLSNLPTPRQLRTDLTRMARDGRQWIRCAREFTKLFSPAQRIRFERLEMAASHFCEGVDAFASDLANSVRSGRPQRQISLRAFIDRMIGIAKKAGVRPICRRYIRGNRIILFGGRLQGEHELFKSSRVMCQLFQKLFVDFGATFVFG
jgi:hypothetical protein